ncbi:glycoside hydrolase family 43 protein [Actinoplanes sp. L3-i22]|uniref:glycoside hydrolase family 43 protein n=1 Tax=Actinoplanes sp. L3-i22 TaxID=2836373 RepID=UPI001C760270|nr:glycoside hydrolase family 43 protein [Actinoplanes sp. L3-i22]BCY13046.1 xylan 1,4-beta-xylosidase [Actinoplanes sp. L3-i22]
MPEIHNPVLPGFHPDPSILRVGADYYLATSTFEWYPGVRLHHSRDLVHWRPLGGVLSVRRLLDLAGVPDSGGVWAPCLTWADGLFHLVFTNVGGYTGFFDTPNYLVTAPSIDGPWSDPVPLHARGFDPSLFHDDDGRSWLLSNQVDWRPGHPWAAGIIAQELDRATGKLLGKPHQVYGGTAAGMTEGPHVYRRDGWYYLVTAEGGTEWFHQATVARSRRLLGPYETDPAGPLLTAVHRPDLALQKAGHGSLVETPAGEWFFAHLAGRPLSAPRGRCVLGRETAVQRVTWTDDGWPRIAGGVPHDVVTGPDLPAHPWPAAPEDFTGPHWNTLRRPADPSWLTVLDPGRVRLLGGRPPSSRAGESLLARRVQHTRASFEATVDFEPSGFQQMAGIVAYYNSRNWYFLRIGWDGGPVAEVTSCTRGRLRSHGPAVPVSGPARFRLDFDDGTLTAAYGSTTWGPFDASTLSDEHAHESDGENALTWGFTGTFVGLWAQDLTGESLPAEFSDAHYHPA